MNPRQFARHTTLAVILGAFFIATGWAALGDNAPPIPPTYKTSHPRLPAPDSGFLTSLAANPTALSRYNAAADAWNSNNPGNVITLRRLLIAYLANKNSNPTAASTYLAKIKALADLGGTWGPLLYSIDDGVGNGTYILTSPSANFLTGCGGSSCQGKVLSIAARTYTITSVPTANSVVLNTNNAAPTGSNLKIRIFSGLNTTANISIALIYDWLYNDLDAATRAEFLKQLDVLCSIWEENYIGIGASPYNDVFYLQIQTFGLIGSLAIYPDHPNGLAHLNFSADVWFNILLPVWKQVFGPEGGGWHESWPDYINPPSGGGLTTFLVPSLLSWQAATGDPIFTREPWLKNFAYYTMYMTRPDFLLENIGDTSRTYLTSEYDLRVGAGFGSLNGLAEIYNDPVIRGWARLVNKESPSGPDGFEPSAWPFYTPDKSANAVASRSALPPVRNFAGWGLVAARTGWSEDDTAVTLRYGDNLWSHEHADIGAFTIFNRGNLAIDSGSYRAGYSSKHLSRYGRQAIAHNTLTITDPADTYTTTFVATDRSGNRIQLPMPNDGGQRRVGSPYNERFSQLNAPRVLGDWLRNWDYYHLGKMVAFASTPTYTYTAVDVTAAYNNRFSATTPNASNRTYRVSKAVRHLLFIPRGTAAYVVVFDQVTSTNASFVKRWLLHSVNQPAVSGKTFQIIRNEQVVPKPWSGGWLGAFGDLLKYDSGSSSDARYQYDGKLYGWMLKPENGTINVVGGPGKEFWIEDPANPGTGANWNECMQGQCTANFEGFGSVEGEINPEPNTAPHEPGSWRIAATPGTPAMQDVFLHVMLATTTGDTSVPANVTVPAGLPGGTEGATWVDGGRTYTVTFPQDGVGGRIAVTGVVDEDLLSHAQPLPDQMEMVSGTSQSGPANTALPNPLVVMVKDSSGNPLPNVAVHYGISEGNGRLDTGAAITDGQGKASASLFLGSGTVGSVTKVLAVANGLAPVEFVATIGSVAPSSLLNSVTCGSTSLSSAATATCTVGLSQAAPAGGSVVALSSSTLALTVPSSVTVPANASSGTFTATAGTISSSQTAVVTATLTGVSRTVSLNLQAATTGGGLLPAGTWVRTPTKGVPAQVVGWEKLVYSPAVKKAVMLGAYHQLGSEPNDALLAYDFETNRWDVLDTLGAFHTENTPEAGHPVGSFVYDPNRSVIQYVCCSSGANQPENIFHTWWYDLLGQVGRDKFTSPKPPPAPTATEAAGAFDTVNDRFLYHGGGSGFGTWSYNPETNAWTRLAPAKVVQSGGAFPTYFDSIAMSSAGYNSTDGKIYLFGGRTGYGNTASYFSDVYSYSFATNTWTLLSPSGSRPAGRQQAGWAYDSTHNVFLMYGGANDSGSSTAVTFDDTWVYDPAANSWTQLNPPVTPAANRGAFERLVYDSDHNVFILALNGSGGYADGTWTGYATQTWLFRYQGSGPDPGQTLRNYEASGGSMNRNAGGWAKEPSLASSGTDLYGAWTETGAPFDVSNGTWPHIFASQRNGSGWTALGGSSLSINSEFGGYVEALSPSLCFAGGRLWVSYYHYNNAGELWKLYAKSWNGTSWSGGPVGIVGSRGYQGRSVLADVAGVPHLAFLEVDKSFYPQKTFVYVKYWDGSQWVLKGSGPLNRSSANTTATSVAIAGDGSDLYVAWTEYILDSARNPTNPQVYVARWDGSQWLPVGASLNVDPAAGWAFDASIACRSGQPFVAWTERSQSGNALLFAKSFNGTGWVPAGSGALNKDAMSGWAFRPSLVADAETGALYVGWVEQQALGQRAQTYVSTFSNGGWTALGSSLNTDQVSGSSQRVSLAIMGGQPVAAWGEVNFGSMRQIYAKQWTGSAWTPLTGTTSGSTPPSCDLNNDGRVNVSDVQIGINQVLGTATCATADLQQNGRCDVVDVQRLVNAALGGACVSGP